MASPDSTLSDGGWYLCGECGIQRRVPKGESTRCEINGAGTQMEAISELVAEVLSMGDTTIVKAWDERDRYKDALRKVVAHAADGTTKEDALKLNTRLVRIIGIAKEALRP